MSIKFIKLTNGDMLIADVTEERISTLELDQPFLIYFAPSPNSNQPSAQFSPYAIFSKEQKIDIDKIHILFYNDPEDNLLQAYANATNKAIILTPPKSKLII